MFKYLEQLDLKVLELINLKLKNRILNKVMPIITYLGNLGLIWIIIGFLFIYNESHRVIGKMIFVALILTTIIGEGIIKHIVKRTRPFVKKVGEKLLINEPLTHSFPSGHTASSFAVATIFIKTDSRIAFCIVILAILIGYSRIYLNVHYPSDVLGGAILGSICGKIVVNIFLA